jgi:imidazolonepropionase-like amidohydrolase
MGTDAGNPLTVTGPSIHAEMEAMQAAGMPAMDVIAAATLNGARAMQRESEIGTVEAGKIADLLVLGADPSQDVANFRQLEAVVRGGRFHTQVSLQRPERGVD